MADPKLVTIQFQGVETGDFRLDSAEITVPEDAVDQTKALIQNIYDASEVIRDKDEQLEHRDGEIEALQAKLDSMSDDPEKLDALSRERTEIIQVAESVGLKRDSLSPLKNAEIKRAVAKARVDGLPDDASEARIDGIFDVVRADVARTAQNKGKMERLGAVTQGAARFDSRTQRNPNGGGKTVRQITSERLRNVHTRADSELRKDFPS